MKRSKGLTLKRYKNGNFKVTRKSFTFQERDDIEILIRWGYWHSFIAKRVLGDDSLQSVRRVQRLASELKSSLNVSVSDYRSGRSGLSKSNAVRALSKRKAESA
jgi:hypothetical protein